MTWRGSRRRQGTPVRRSKRTALLSLPGLWLPATSPAAPLIMQAQAVASHPVAAPSRTLRACRPSLHAQTGLIRRVSQQAAAQRAVGRAPARVAAAKESSVQERRWVLAHSADLDLTSLGHTAAIAGPSRDLEPTESSTPFRGPIAAWRPRRASPTWASSAWRSWDRCVLACDLHKLPTARPPRCRGATS